MPIAEYILLALLGSTTAGIAGNTLPRAYGVDTVVQPSGGTADPAAIATSTRAGNSNTQKKTSNANTKSGLKRGHKGGKKGKKSSGGTTTPAPK
jgi:hypothetical protein